MDESNGAPVENRSRLIFVGGSLLVLAVVVGIVLLAGGSDEASDEEDAGGSFGAPSECIEAWNADRQAVAAAQHNVAGHGYSAAQVGYITNDGSLGDDPDEGACAVVFGATQLDIDLVQVGQVNEGGAWRPLSESLENATLELLQTSALELSNAAIGADGSLTPQ